MVSKERLRELYVKEEMTQGEIADELGYSQPYISRKMSEHDIDSSYAFWAEEEEEYLRENYQSSSKEEILEHFSDRTWKALKDKARDLGVAMTAEERRNSEEVLQRLRKNSEENAIKIDLENSPVISYLLGVLDGDGFTDNKGTVGLEAKDKPFVKKFMRKLREAGFNPGNGMKDEKHTVWASSLQFTNWYENLSDDQKFEWLKEKGNFWKYIEGQYESDGNIHPSGSPRICSYDEQEKLLIKRIFDCLGIHANIQQNNVWVSKTSAEDFFQSISPVIRKPSRV